MENFVPQNFEYRIKEIEKFSNKIQELVYDYNYKYAKLSKITGLSVNTIRKMETLDTSMRNKNDTKKNNKEARIVTVQSKSLEKLVKSLNLSLEEYGIERVEKEELKKYSYRIKELRVENGETVKQLAEALDVNSSIVTNWEKSRFEPTLKSFIDLSNHFNVTIDYLVGKDSSREDSQQLAIVSSKTGFNVKEISEIQHLKDRAKPQNRLFDTSISYIEDISEFDVLKYLINNNNIFTPVKKLIQQILIEDESIKYEEKKYKQIIDNEPNKKNQINFENIKQEKIEKIEDIKKDLLKVIEKELEKYISEHNT